MNAHLLCQVLEELENYFGVFDKNKLPLCHLAYKPDCVQWR